MLPQPVQVVLALFLIVGLLALIFFFVGQAPSPEQGEDDPSERLRQRFNGINEAFAEAAALMEDLQRDLRAQQAAREALVAEAEEQQRLLEVNRDQAEKIRHILVGATKTEARASRRRDWMLLAAGALLSIPIGVAVNLLVP